jgi:hypothetical protein
VSAQSPEPHPAALLYASMGTGELAELRAAFELDIANATMPSTVAFGTGRIALIDAELARRRPPAVQRLMDEVRLGDATPHGLFDRAHNRHNR